LVWALHYYLTRTDVPSHWGDLTSGLLFERTRQNLLKLEDSLYHPKNWRPFVLAFSGTGFSRPHLVVFGSWLTRETGVLSLGQVIPGGLKGRSKRLASQEAILHSMIKERRLAAFPAVVVANDYPSGVQGLVQCQGLGRLRPNVVLMGCPLSVERMVVFGGLLRNLEEIGRSVVVLRQTDESLGEHVAPPGTVDVWWRGRANGELMVLLAHLMLSHPTWRGRQLRLLRVVPRESGIAEVKSHLDGLLREARITGTTKVVVDENAANAIQATSCDAAFVYLGMSTPEEGQDEDFLHHLEELVGGLPRVAFVRSAGGVKLES
jgi:hypothetical protein